MNENLLKVVEDELKSRQGAHDMSHILRVLETAREIAGQENANIKIVEAMVLLHDIVRFEGAKETESVERAIGKAKQILEKTGYSRQEIEEIVKGIKSHSIHSKMLIEPETLEEKVLFDADKIDAAGSIGIARWFMTMGNRNISVKEAAKLYLKEAKDLECKRKGKLYTETGTRIIKPKIAESKNFMEQLTKLLR